MNKHILCFLAASISAALSPSHALAQDISGQNITTGLVINDDSSVTDSSVTGMASDGSGAVISFSAPADLTIDSTAINIVNPNTTTGIRNAQDGSTITLQNNSIMTGAGDYAAIANFADDVTINIDDSQIFSGTERTSQSIFSNADNTTVNVQNSKIYDPTSDTNYQNAIELQGNNSTVNVGQNSVINGVLVGSYNGVITDTAINIDNSTVNSGNAYGNHMSVTSLNTANSNISITNSTINLAENGAPVGIYLWTTNNDTALLSHSTVTGDAEDAYGFGGQDLINNSMTLDDANITLGGNASIGVILDGTISETSGNTLNIENNSTINMSGEATNGIALFTANTSAVALDNSSVQAAQGTGILLDSSAGNTINIQNGASITAKEGILVSGTGAGNIFNVTDSAITGTENAIHIASPDAVDVNIAGSAITGNILTDSTTVQSVDMNGSAFKGNAVTSADAAGLNLQMTGGSAWEGDVVNGATAGNTQVSLDQSTWKGKATNDGNSQVNVALSNGASWVTTGDSDVSSLDMRSNSSVVMDGGNINTVTLTDGSASSATLAAAAAPAPATIYSTWNAAAGSAYVLTAGTATGTFNAGVTSNSSGAAGDMTGDTIVQVGDASGATFNSMQSDVGVYRYQSSTVVNADGSTSVILDNITPTPPVPPTPPTPPVPPTPPAPPTPTPPTPTPPTPKPTLSTAAQAVVDTRAAAVNLWNDEQDALNLRMDNERRTGSSDGIVNAWGSYYGGYHRQQMDLASSIFDQTNNGFMVGADKRISAAEGDWLFGASVMRGFSDVNMHDSGSVGTDIDSYGASIYASYRMNNGLFFDASIKGTHLKNDISVVSVDGGKTSGDYSTNGFGGALKGGYHMELRSFFIEPYAQVSYARYNGVDYTLKNGLRAKDDDYTSVRVEGGANIGTSIPLHSGAEVRPYLHLAAAGETENGNTMNINGVTIDDSTDGAQGVVGLGTDVKFTKNLGAWAGANYAKGQNHSESPWQLNAGVSYTW